MAPPSGQPDGHPTGENRSVLLDALTRAIRAEPTARELLLARARGGGRELLVAFTGTGRIEGVWP